MSEYQHLSQESNLISSDDYEEVVKHLNEGNEGILDAVQQDTTIFNNEIPEDAYVEDQKNFIPWNGHDYEASEYVFAGNEQGGVVYPALAPPLTISVPQIPASQDYAGELNFAIEITQHMANRNSWIFSAMLNKVFINMQNILPVDVKRSPSSVPLYLRATLLYSLPQFAQELVERCSAHTDPKQLNNKDVEQSVVKHVLRCTNAGSKYQGDADHKEHLSVVTPLGQPQAGTNSVRVNYQFMCKNSCPSGMNRRAVDIIFTLEDARCNVLGRRKLSVRICSCPKRDKEKEENEFQDVLAQKITPHGKKRRALGVVPRPDPGGSTNVHDDDVVYDVHLRIKGRERVRTGVKLIRDMHASDLYHNSSSFDSQKKASIREIILECNTLLKKFGSGSSD